MSTLKQAKTEEEINSLGVKGVREAYKVLARQYNQIIDGEIYYCHKCNGFYRADSFYNDKRFASGVFPICKKCMQDIATDYDKKEKVYVDNKEKTMKAFQMMDLPFIDSLYQSALKSTSEALGEKNRSTAYLHMLTIVKSLDQYRGLSWKDSEFDAADETQDGSNVGNRRPRREIKKIFGGGFTDEDYLYLQDQYDDWRARTQVDSKSQETYVVQISMQLLDIYKSRKSGDDVTNKLKALDQLMNAANLQPKQNVSNAATDSLTFGQLIERWEENKPIPEPSEEFRDVDGIGKYIRVWFTGWLSKALGLKANVFTQEYEDEIQKYIVTKPEYKDEDSSDAIYDRLFGNDGGD